MFTTWSNAAETKSSVLTKKQPQGSAIEWRAFMMSASVCIRLRRCHSTLHHRPLSSTCFSPAIGRLHLGVVVPETNRFHANWIFFFHCRNTINAPLLYSDKCRRVHTRELRNSFICSVLAPVRNKAFKWSDYLSDHLSVWSRTLLTRVLEKFLIV